jgi:lipoyl(octanoyl) transferase
MSFEQRNRLNSGGVDPLLQVYLLGMVDFELALALQRHLAYEVAGRRGSAALVLCEHPPLVTIGRQGSWRQILCEPGELKMQGWPVRWVNRGSGCVLHLPGQLAIYPILPLDQLGLGLVAYLERFRQVLIDLLSDFSISALAFPGKTTIWANGRPIADLGVAVRDWVSYYGAVLNVNPDLEHFRLVRTGGAAGGIMTSLARERHGPVRPSLVRERLLEHFSARFSFGQPALFFDHPSIKRKAPSDALATSR